MFFLNSRMKRDRKTKEKKKTERGAVVCLINKIYNGKNHPLQNNHKKLSYALKCKIKD